MKLRAIIAICLAGISLLLAGCEQTLARTGDVSISRDGDKLLVAACSPLSIEQFAVSARLISQPFSGPVRVITLDGEATFDAGQIYTVGDSLQGMKISESNPVDLDDIRDLSVEAASPEPPYNAVFRVWDLDETPLPKVGWLLPDGDISATPCN
ncbi:MAG: hypothetical protein IT192_07710 [Microbacteriaceae bacterium]|nr:hypothetical protein [Microbacteriaceae bacterium]